MEEVIVETGLNNYYGEVTFVEINGQPFMSLENYDGSRYVPISKRLFQLAKKEFRKSKNQLTYKEVTNEKTVNGEQDC